MLKQIISNLKAKVIAYPKNLPQPKELSSACTLLDYDSIRYKVKLSDHLQCMLGFKKLH